MKLYSYWRSTTSVRVRIALNLKGVDYTYVAVNLLAGEQGGDAFAAVNPSRGVPALELDDGTILTQSVAILEYIDEVYPDPPLLPADQVARAQVRGAAACVALDIHPLNNLRILNYLKDTMGQSQDDTVAWMRHWMTNGFTAMQKLVKPDTPFCFGDRLDLADISLVSQMVNARRFDLDLSPFPRLVEIDTACRQIDAVHRGLPESQPDATPL